MILGIIEHDRGLVNPACLEMLTFARNLTETRSGQLGAILVGANPASVASEVQGFGVSVLYSVQHPAMTDFAPAAWGKGIAQLLTSVRPEIVMAAGTDRGNEILAHVAAVANLPMAANCLGVQVDDPLRVIRYRWGSSLLEEALLKGTPKLLTTALQITTAEAATTPSQITVEPFTPDLAPEDLRAQVTAREENAAEGITLKSASVVIGGGRGVGSPEGFKILEELAGLLGGAVGGSRVATNNGWRPHADQIGLTGNRIAPTLYIACGISGAIQHLVGCKGAKHVLVINKDPEAPFLRRADYGVIGDLHEILPALIEAIKRRKEL